MFLAILAAVIILLLLCILFVPIRAEVVYSESALKIYIRILGFRIRLPYGKNKSQKAQKRDKEKKSPIKKEKSFTENLTKLSERITKLSKLIGSTSVLTKKYIKVNKLKVTITEGFGDAALTAVSIGLMWTAIYNVIGLIGNFLYINKPDVTITPAYNTEIFKYRARCIISSRIAYIIYIILKIKTRKGKEE